MDYKEINDYELLYMISDNDYSLDLLLEKYKPFVNQKLQRYNDYFYKYGIDIEDLRQEIYLSLIYAVNNFDENSDASFYTYLNVLIEHKISNFWREQFSAKNSILLNSISLASSVNDNLTVADILADNSAGIEDIIIEENILREVYNFCYDLSIEDAFVFELYLNGYSRQSISFLLNLSYKRTSYLICKIKDKLKKYLSKIDLLVI